LYRGKREKPSTLEGNSGAGESRRLPGGLRFDGSFVKDEVFSTSTGKIRKGEAEEFERRAWGPRERLHELG